MPIFNDKCKLDFSLVKVTETVGQKGGGILIGATQFLSCGAD